MRVHGIAGVLLYANEPEALSGWYGRLLGLTFTNAAGGRRLEARLGAPDEGGPVLAIEEATEPLADGARDAALVLQVADLDALLRRLELRGIEPDEVEQLDPGRRAWIRDPEGRRLGLHEAPAVATQKAPAEKPPMQERAAQEPAAEEPAVHKPAVVQQPEVHKPEVHKPAVVQQPVAQEPAAQEPAVHKPAVQKPAVVQQPVVQEPAAQEPAIQEPAAQEPSDKASATQDDDAQDDDARAAAAAEEAPVEPERVGAPAPLIVSVRPEKISSQYGGPVRILGANFAEGVQIRLGGAPCAAQWHDSGLIEFTAPPRPPGPCTIELQNPDEQRVAGAVLYELGPEIARITPAEGPPRGGTEVLVEGSRFHPECVVSFGEHAPEVRHEAPGRLRFITPGRHDSGYRIEVRVTNPDGFSCAAPGGFTYRSPAPRIHAVSPGDGYMGGGKRITVSGEDFEAGCVARVGGQTATATWRSAQAVDVIVPPAAAPGPVDVEIESPDGQIARAPGAFTYALPPAPPKLIEVRPDRGFISGGTELHLHGDNFDEATIVRIAEVRVPVRFVSRKELVIETPPRAEPGVVAIELTDASGVAVRRDDAFTYEARKAPRVTSVTPRSGPMVGGTRVLVEGEHFPPSATVRVGRQPPPRAVVRSATLLELVTPPSRDAGFVDLEIGGPECGMTTVKNAFRYDASPPPLIESVAPNRGGVAGGTELSISGKGFVVGTTVLLAGKPAARVKVVDATTLEVKTPPGTDGQMVDVVVRNPDGKEAVARRAFQYDARYRG